MVLNMVMVNTGSALKYSNLVELLTFLKDFLGKIFDRFFGQIFGQVF